MKSWKNFKLKNPILFSLLLIFLIVNLVDGITAFFILPAEANPLFLFTGSIWAVLLFKVVIIGALIFYHIRNKYPNYFMYYLVVLILMLGIAVIGLAAYSNILGIQNPEAVEAAANIPDSVKVQQYVNFATWLYYIPLVFCIFTFILYDSSRKHIDVDPEYFNRKKWWKRW